MVSMIRTGIDMYKKANNLDNAERKDYPKILENLFGIKVTSYDLDLMNGNDLMMMLMKKEDK